MAPLHLLLVALVARHAQGTLFPGGQIDLFDWSTIKPSRDLVYTDCMDGMKCARLLAPLDWSKHGDSPCGLGSLDTNNSVAIAIVTLPASVPESDESFGGSVLWNPGGPGGMATLRAKDTNRFYQDMLDGTKHYEIIGFDPRGVGASTPQIKSKTAESISPRHGRAALATQFEQQAAIGEICMEAGPDSIHAHSGTASAARDMLHIVDKVEEERISRLGSDYVPAYDKPRLQYMGASYGTGLGSYFASMFPGRVARMLLSGILDSELHRYGKGFDILPDTEAAIEYVYEHCFETSCLFSNDSDTGPEDIKARVQAALDWLDGTPVLVADIVARDVSSQGTIFSSWDFDEETGSWLDIPFTWSHDAATVISCLDMHARKPEMDLDWAYERYKAMEAESPTAAEFRYLMHMRCARWTITPAYDFQEPFGAPPPEPDLAPDAPAAPLFLLNARLDPTTPLVSAWTTSRLYPNSSVMIIEMAGHDNFERADDCVFDAARAYFDDGVVPPNGTICQPAPYTGGQQSDVFRALL
ncbi:Alpha/Beta hydrolase protein [Plectosphaerella plurivora]|uniref:Alpha/Beta hydrolase protein n=1 Tax=Plectosphaerella plurivora TaxID=936078 RepID=A0A9P8V647_9PEZI|nr:Alpha/Beta hydrolase protein [Plectosphaerella plurivora]